MTAITAQCNDNNVLQYVVVSVTNTKIFSFLSQLTDRGYKHTWASPLWPSEQVDFMCCWWFQKHPVMNDRWMTDLLALLYILLQLCVCVLFSWFTDLLNVCSQKSDKAVKNFADCGTRTFNRPTSEFWCFNYCFSVTVKWSKLMNLLNSDKLMNASAAALMWDRCIMNLRLIDLFIILTKSSLMPFFSLLCPVFHFKVFPLPFFLPYILPSLYPSFLSSIEISLPSLLRLGEVTVSSQQRLSGSLSSSCLTGLSTGWMAYIHSAQLLHNLTVLILFQGLNVWFEARPMWHPDWPPPG